MVAERNGWWRGERLLPALLGLCCGLSAPQVICARAATAFLHEDAAVVVPLARAVAAEGNLQRADFQTGSERFDGEWLFGTHMMAIVGLAQTMVQQPAAAEELRVGLRGHAARMVAPEGLWFDAEAWGTAALGDENLENHHVAALGYAGFALGLAVAVDPDGGHAELQRAIEGAITRRFEHLPADGSGSFVWLQTYPGEIYLVDNAAALGAVALGARARGEGVPGWVRERAVALVGLADGESGLLPQALSVQTGEPLDAPRGSGTTLAAFFLDPVDHSLSTRLAVAARESLNQRVGALCALREYPAGQVGNGDIDSGPLVGGLSISATGFALAGARLIADEAWFTGLGATTVMFGVPGDRGFQTGGPLGNAILLAMLTQPWGGR